MFYYPQEVLKSFTLYIEKELACWKEVEKMVNAFYFINVYSV